MRIRAVMQMKSRFTIGRIWGNSKMFSILFIFMLSRMSQLKPFEYFNSGAGKIESLEVLSGLTVSWMEWTI